MNRIVQTLEQEIETCKKEMEEFVADYNHMYGEMSLRILGARYGKMCRRLTGQSVRDFVTKSQLFWVMPKKSGGMGVWARSVPMP